MCPLKQTVGFPSLSTPERITYEYLPAGHSSCRPHGALVTTAHISHKNCHIINVWQLMQNFNFLMFMHTCIMHACMHARTHALTHTHTHDRFMAFWIFSGHWGSAGTRRNIHPLTPLICFLHLSWSMASSLFTLHAWQSFTTISLQVFLAGHLPSQTPYISLPKKSLSSFLSPCPYHRNLFCCGTEVNPFLGTLSCSWMQHIHQTILISARWNVTSFPFL